MRPDVLKRIERLVTRFVATTGRVPTRVLIPTDEEWELAGLPARRIGDRVASIATVRGIRAAVEDCGGHILGLEPVWRAAVLAVE